MGAVDRDGGTTGWRRGDHRVIAHHLCIEFREDGTVDFYPHTADAAELTHRLTGSGRIAALLSTPPRVIALSGRLTSPSGGTIVACKGERLAQNGL